MDLYQACLVAARSGVEGALTVLLVLTAFATMVAGPKGARWVLRKAFEPVRMLLERKITALIYLCTATLVAYYVGHRLFPPR